MHRHQLQVNAQLSESLSEIRVQHEEIRMQKEALLGTNAVLERSLAAQQEAEEILAATLEESQRAGRLYATVSETVSDGLAVFDPDGTIVYSNAAYHRIMNMREIPENSIDTTGEHYQLLTTEGVVVPPNQYPIARVLAGEMPDPPTEYLLMLDDGSHRVILKECVPLTGGDGNKFGALSVVRDITTEYHDSRNSEILRELAHACAGAPDEAALAAAAVRVIGERLAVPFCVVFARDHDREGFAHVLSAHLGSETPRSLFEEHVGATCQHTYRGRCRLHILTGAGNRRDALQCPGGAKGKYPSWQFASSVVSVGSYLPIKVEEQTMGVFFISHGSQQLAIWNEAEQDLLQAVADELNLAWHRAQLYEDARRLALYDPLTGLHNHRALQQILQSEIGVSESQHAPVTVIMLDIDHFRTFNENYGHDIGDQALRTVAQAIKNSLRPGDYAARYGGEEFTIILPGIEEDQAARVAERIRTAIANNPVSVPGIAQGVPITASLGFATLPIDAVTSATLLKCADVALYAAKHRGRNRVVAYEDSLTSFPTLLAS